MVKIKLTFHSGEVMILYPKILSPGYLDNFRLQYLVFLVVSIWSDEFGSNRSFNQIFVEKEVYLLNKQIWMTIYTFLISTSGQNGIGGLDYHMSQETAFDADTYMIYIIII